MNSPIDYTHIKSFLASATLYELSRFAEMLENELQAPNRIAEVKNQFKEGDTIEYFHRRMNRLLSARVLKKDPKGAWVKNCCDAREWKIPYHCIKLDGRTFSFSQKEGQLDKNSLSIGDSVGFIYEGLQITGRIERLNGKSASLKATDGKKWRVAYSYLYPIIEGEQSTSPHHLIYEK